MKHAEILKKNKDLDLRRFGRNEYSKALAQEKDPDSGPVPSDLTLDSFVKLMFPTKLIGMVESNNAINWGSTIEIIGNIIPIDELKDYMLQKLEESLESSVYITFLPIMEYDAAFVNNPPSWTDIKINAYDGQVTICDISNYSFNAEAEKDGTLYLVGLNPGD